MSQYDSVIVSQYDSVTVSQCHSVTVSQCHKVGTKVCHNNTEINGEERRLGQLEDLGQE